MLVFLLVSLETNQTNSLENKSASQMSLFLVHSQGPFFGIRVVPMCQAGPPSLPKEGGVGKVPARGFLASAERTPTLGRTEKKAMKPRAAASPTPKTVFMGVFFFPGRHVNPLPKKELFTRGGPL